MRDFLFMFAQATLEEGGQAISIPKTSADSSLFTGTVLPLIFGILGALSLLYVVIGGFRYVVSAGDPGNTQKARETILYALIGLVVSISAFTIVNFVLDSVVPDESTGGLTGPNGIITQIIQLLAYLVGVVSVIMIIYGGFKYIVSGGDSAGTKTARDTILNAVIGLVIAISAQAIVTFVLGAI